MNYDQSTQLTQKNWITFSSNERRKVHTVTNPMLHVLFSIEFFVCFPFLVSFWIFFYFHCYKVNVEKRWQHFTHKNRGWEIKHKNRSLCQDSDPKMVCNVLLFYYSTKCRWLLEKKQQQQQLIIQSTEMNINETRYAPINIIIIKISNNQQFIPVLERRIEIWMVHIQKSQCLYGYRLIEIIWLFMTRTLNR